MDAGYKVLLGIDNDKASLETYRRNIKGAKGLDIDLFDPKFTKTIKQSIDTQVVDVIVAGPPCQGFSLTGSRKFDDKRNTLYLSVFQAVKSLTPKAFVIENVKGMKTLYGGTVKEEIVRRFTALGYRLPEPRILCSADYGVPQIRERLFFVGLREDLGEYDYPIATHFPDSYVTCFNALADLPSREKDYGMEVDAYDTLPRTDYQKYMRDKATQLYNHVSTRHTDLVKEVIRQVPEGGNYKDLPPGVGTSRRFNEAWTRYHSKRPSRTIDTGHRNHFHYKYDRVPTVRENARLQSFPDDFIFMGTRTQQNRQVGNAVPPILAQAIATELIKYLK